MKIYNINFLFALIFGSIFTLNSCQIEKKDGSTIYAPNGEIFSTSIEELSSHFAKATGTKVDDISIKDISFLEVPKGYVAEVHLLDTRTQALGTIYCPSRDLLPDIEFEGNPYRNGKSVPETTNRSIPPPPIMWCQCSGGGVWSDGSCQQSFIIQNGKLTMVCQNGTCSAGCFISFVF